MAENTPNEEQKKELAKLEQIVRQIAADPTTSLTVVVQALAAFMSQTELDNLRRWITTDALPAIKQREAVAEAVAEERAQIIETVKENLTEEDLIVETDEQGARPWKKWHPTDPASWFFYGDRAIDSTGKVWESVVDPTGHQPNVWEPGAPGIDSRFWKEYIEPEEIIIPEGDQPTAPLGDKENPIPFADGTAVMVDQYVVADGVTYRVRQSHTMAAHWPPASVPSLFEPA